jgi:oligoendopeptidase F
LKQEFAVTEKYELSGWDLSDLNPAANGGDLDDSLNQLDEKVAAFESFRSVVQGDVSTETFLNMVAALEDISRLAAKIQGYAGLWFSEDTQNQAAHALLARVEHFMALLHNRTLFFELWWKQLDDETAGPLMEASGDRAYWLAQIRLFKPFTLSEPEERVINIKDVTGFSALTRLYDSITNRYVFHVDVDGEEYALTRGELMVFARHHRPEIRAGAYQELYRVYGQDGPILGQMYQTLVRDWAAEHLELRGHKDPMAVRNLANDLPDTVVDTLLDVCREQAGLFRRYFALKARHLGMDKIRRYDLYAPLAESDKTFDFNQAVDMVLSAFGAFDSRMANGVQKVINDRHVDSEVRAGKRDGAFCASVLPELSPYVLLNYQGKPEDVATLAHEMGHAIHSILASDHSIFTFQSSLPLAENASTFGEMLLVDYLLERESDPGVRRDLLFKQVDDAYATILRQAYFALFEREAHQLVVEGATVDELADAYWENLKDQFQDGLELSDEFRWEWVSIPHIYHTPFYVYAYSFGQLLVFSLYQQYRLDREKFKPRYLKILSAGGSVSPGNLLSDAGMDIAAPEFWRGGFEVVEGLIKQLEEL